MHPAYRSNKPGIAPDCGMALVPVYEGEAGVPQKTLQAGDVELSPERQRLIGIRVAVASKSAGTRMLRTTGRVVPDENHLYRIQAGVDGWVESLNQNPPGTLVTKDQVLATLYSPDIRAAESAYVGFVAGVERVKGNVAPDNLKAIEESGRVNEEQLRLLGMGDKQIKDLAASHRATSALDLVAPGDGIVLARGISPKQRFEKGAELYRIADLSKVWIIADIHGDDGELRPGTRVKVNVPGLGKSIKATVSTATPLFDEASRTLKLRLEAENPGYLLRPDMFVDVEFESSAPTGLSIPADAVLDSGVRVVPVYDRSELIHRAISNSRNTLIEVVVTVVVVILVFLWHFPKAVIPVITIPVAILLAFIPLYYLGVGINILSLAGIALACGELVDAAIVVVEQTYKKLELHQRSGVPFSYEEVILEAVREVAAPTFFALLVIAVSFLPVLVLEGQEGKLFRPLVYAKSFAFLAAAILALTLDPALRLLLVRKPSHNTTDPNPLQKLRNWLLGGAIRREDQHLITGPLIRIYDPVLRWTLRFKWQVIGGAVVLVLLTIPVALRLGSELMPRVEEGSLLYMPSTMPGISIAEAQRLLVVTDGILKSFPEVDRVLGKAGRANTATDPAPLSMLETIVVLKPQSEWRKRQVWYSSWAPDWTLPVLRHITSDHISEEKLVAEMNDTLSIPGVSNSWTMPIRGRIEMLTTGIRTPVGLKIQGKDLNQIQQIGHQVEAILGTVPGTRSVFAERTAEGFFLDVTWNRAALAQYGLSMEDAQNALSTEVGGDNVSTVIDGRARYPINVRYMRDFRSDLEVLGKVLIPISGEKQIPLSELASVRTLTGPAMIRDEDGALTGYVFVDTGSRATGDYVEQARGILDSKLTVPPGYVVSWSGQYESAQRVKQRLMVVVPVTIALILLLLYFNTRSFVKTMIVTLAVPFSAVGAVWLVYLLGYNMNIAVWVGIVALLGIDAETGVFMLLYLDLAFEKSRRAKPQMTQPDLVEAIVEGAAKRLRPKFMTFATMTIGLAPILWSTGTGSAILKRIAAPMVGGILTSFALEVLVYPAIYAIWRGRALHSEVQEQHLATT